MEESDWLGQFSIYAAACHAIGSFRGERSQLSACGIAADRFLSHLGSAINAMLLDQPVGPTENASNVAQAHPEIIHAGNTMSQSGVTLKTRWVDSTPEYVLYIAALRGLFPEARFIHVVRDATSVVRSMLLFRNLSGFDLVRNEQEAYEYWLTRVRAGAAAEQAWGSRVVMRVRYRDLTEAPADTLSRILDFVSEPFSQACLQPLLTRINSSAVPADFDAYDPATDPAVRAEAAKLEAEVLQDFSPTLPGDDVMAAQLGADFTARVEYFAGLENMTFTLQAMCRELDREVKDRGLWATDLASELKAKDAYIASLLEHGAVKDRQIAQLERQWKEAQTEAMRSPQSPEHGASSGEQF